jgi:hypothetical protein
MNQFLVLGALVGHDAYSAEWAYHTYQDLLLDLGTLRQARFFVPDDEVFALAEPRQCFHNAFQGCTELDGYTYVEGYAQTNLLVVAHAWLEDPDGNIVDPTWGQHIELDESVTPTYYGIQFDTKFVLRRAFENRRSSILAHEWASKPDFPSLRFGLVTNDEGLVIGYKEVIT